MPRSGPGPLTGRPSSRIWPRSGVSKPASSEMSVVLPDPDRPTIATNSPRSMVRSIWRSTSVRRPGGPNPLARPSISRKAISGGPEALLDDAHEAVEGEADEADGDDAQDDVLVDEAVV